ncbi:unnamed protein product, partial [Sphacelaria rigidula]
TVRCVLSRVATTRSAAARRHAYHRKIQRYNLCLRYNHCWLQTVERDRDMAATATSLQPPWRSHPVVSASSASSSFDDSSATTTAVSSPVRATTSSTNINEAQQQPRSSTESSFGEEFFAEPEWQRAPGRWKKSEEKLLREMKVLLADDLQRAKSQGVAFPEVVGSRRMLRFLR